MERQAGPHLNRKETEGNWHLLIICSRRGSVLYALSSPLLQSLFVIRNWGSKGLKLTQSFKPERSIIRWASRFFRKFLFCPSTVLKRNFHKNNSGDKCSTSSSLNKGLWEQQRAQWNGALERKGVREGITEDVTFEPAMLNSWSWSCWITNVLIFWLHLLGTYQEPQSEGSNNSSLCHQNCWNGVTCYFCTPWFHTERVSQIRR